MNDLMLTFLIGITSGGFTLIGIMIQRDRKEKAAQSKEAKDQERKKESIKAKLEDNLRLLTFSMLHLSVATAESLIDNNGKSAVKSALAKVKEDTHDSEKNNTELTRELFELLGEKLGR